MCIFNGSRHSTIFFQRYQHSNDLSNIYEKQEQWLNACLGETNPQAEIICAVLYSKGRSSIRKMVKEGRRIIWSHIVSNQIIYTSSSLNLTIMLFKRVFRMYFWCITSFFFSYQLFKLKLKFFSIKLPTNCSVLFSQLPTF